MIEKTVLDYLDRELTAKVYMETPAKPPGTYVLLEKTGSGAGDGLLEATLAVQSIAPTLYGAASLNELVKSAMGQLRDRATNVFRCELNGDYNFTDTENKRYRYQAVFDLTYKE